jgi:carboxyl-terminal processing protease
MRKLLYLTIILSAGLLAACKKEKKTPIVTGPPSTGSTLDLIKDSVYLYFKEENLWHGAAPDYATFNPRATTGTNDIGALQNELDKLSQYAINSATGKPYEYSTSHPGHAKYSFIDDGTVSAALNGVKGDFGLGLEYNTPTDLRITYVYPGSPAALAGIRRGYAITSINNSANISYDGVSNGVTYGNGSGTNLAMVNNAIFNSSTISMTLKKYDGTTLTVANMSVASYTVNPVLKDTVYTSNNGHKVGYIVFNSFTFGSNATPVLDAAFGKFATQGITDLVVDLRYNGGGYVSTAEYLDNLIAPASASGKLMYNTYFTDNMVKGTDPLLAHQWRKDSKGNDFNYAQIDFSVAAYAVNFSKQGSLNVNRVFFIVTGSTASASELTINNLRPIMDVQFIGRKTYGKPVGFFDIDINKYIMYTPEFSTKNSVGQGDYYDGFTPGDPGYPGVLDYDDPTKDFGDPTEGLLAHALHFVTLGTYSVQNPVTQGIGTKTLSLQQQSPGGMGLDPRAFNGMIFDKKLKLK